jgi:hypothetical protein
MRTYVTQQEDAMSHLLHSPVRQVIMGALRTFRIADVHVRAGRFGGNIQYIQQKREQGCKQAQNI